MGLLEEADKLAQDQAKASQDARAVNPNPSRPTPGQDFMSGLRRGGTASPAAALSLANLGGVGNPEFTEELRRDLQRTSGEPAPTNFMGRLGERIGTGAPFALTGMGAGYAMGGVPLLLGEIAANVIGPVAGQAVEEMGGGPLAQMGAEAVAGGLVPPYSSPSMLGRSARRLTRGADRAVAVAQEVGASPMSGGVTPSALAVRRLGKAKRGSIPFDVDTGEPQVGPVVRKLRASARAGGYAPGNRNRTASTAQSAGRRGGSRLQREEAAAVRQSGEYENFRASRQIATEDFLVDRWNRIRPNGSVEDVNRTANALHQSMRKRNKYLWSLVPDSEDPGMDLVGIKAAARKVVGRAERNTALGALVPEEAWAILDLPDSMPVKDFQDVASEFFTVIREFGKRTSGGRERVSAKKLAPIQEAMHKAIRELDTDGSDAYRAARKATADFYEVFPEDSKVTETMLEIERPDIFASRMKRTSKTIEKEVAAAKQMLGDSEQGEEAFRAVILDDLYGQGGLLEGRTPRAARSDLLKYDKFYKAVFGEEGYKQQLEIVNEFRKVREFVTAKQGSVFQTGSATNAPDVPGMVENTRNLLSVKGMAETAGAVLDRFWRWADDARFGSALMHAFREHPDIAADILEAQDPQNIERFVIAMDKMVSFAVARSSRGLAAASRSFGNPDIQVGIEVGDLSEGGR